MKYKEEEIIKYFDLHSSGQKGWYSGSCPYCGKDKFGIKFNTYYKGKRISSFNCFSGKCGKHGIIYELLKDFNKLDLVDLGYVNVFKELDNKSLLTIEEGIDYTMKKYPIPIGYKRIYSHNYLNSRGFIEEHFKVHNIGIAPLDPKIGKNYVVFLCEDEDICIGWVKRSIFDKEYIEASNKNILRWGNSKGTDFEKFVYGIDECVEGKTYHIILVESITSKANIDRLLDLFNRDDIKCCCTFGKKISLAQVKRLLDKNIKIVTLLFDPDAVKESKIYSIKLEKYFKVFVGFVKDISKDPGNLTLKELEIVLSNLESPIVFSLNKLQKKKLWNVK